MDPFRSAVARSASAGPAGGVRGPLVGCYTRLEGPPAHGALHQQLARRRAFQIFIHQTVRKELSSDPLASLEYGFDIAEGAEILAGVTLHNEKVGLLPSFHRPHGPQ